MKVLALCAIALSYASVALADNVPECLDQRGSAITSPNNDEVIQWKRSTPNLYLDRAYVRGTLVSVYDHTPEHLHVEVSLGGRGASGKDDKIEVVYNQEFGEVDRAGLRPGMEVIACGDYITSTQSAQYPASPVGAILHWVHAVTHGHHESGFLMIDGVLYGQRGAGRRYQR